MLLTIRKTFAFLSLNCVFLFGLNILGIYLTSYLECRLARSNMYVLSDLSIVKVPLRYLCLHSTRAHAQWLPMKEVAEELNWASNDFWWEQLCSAWRIAESNHYISTYSSFGEIIRFLRLYLVSQVKECRCYYHSLWIAWTLTVATWAIVWQSLGSQWMWFTYHFWIMLHFQPFYFKITLKLQIAHNKYY